MLCYKILYNVLEATLLNLILVKTQMEFSSYGYRVQNKNLSKPATIKWYNSTETIKCSLKQNIPKVGGRQILEKVSYIN